MVRHTCITTRKLGLFDVILKILYELKMLPTVVPLIVNAPLSVNFDNKRCNRNAYVPLIVNRAFVNPAMM